MPKKRPDSRIVDAPPKASSLIESMRDIGYTLDTALADVIDNSISAGARNIHIRCDMTGNEPVLAILDNGMGMTRDQLVAAMRLGSRSPKDARKRHDLGRFGLGMKTASFSQCRRLTVITSSRGEMAAATWDLDRVEKEDAWSLEVHETFDHLPFADELVRDGSIVVWEKLDRALENEVGEQAASDFAVRLAAAAEHLSLVFHRFMEDPAKTRVTIQLNGIRIEPTDPFCRDHSATQQGPTEEVTLRGARIKITPFTLPHHRNITADEWERNAGRDGYIRGQGFYLYRERRLIVRGTWFGLARQTELTKLSRVMIDVPNTLDEEWQVDVKKAFARPPAAIRARLRTLVESMRAPSRRVYTKRAQRITEARLPLWTRAQVDNRITYAINPDSPAVKNFKAKLGGAAKRDFERLIHVLGAGFPMDALYSDLAAVPEQVGAAWIDDDALEALVEETLEGLVAAGLKEDQARAMIRLSEPFTSQWSRVEPMLIEKVGK